MDVRATPQGPVGLPTEPRLERFRRLLQKADVEIGGQRPWDMQIHDPETASRVLAHGSLGLGESYMDGWWDCAAPDQLIDRLLRAHLEEQVSSPEAMLLAIESRLFNRQSVSRAWTVAREHYDLGNDFFAAMLDPEMVYSCAWWGGRLNADDGDLAAAQQAKLDLICRKLGLQPGMTLLDIGCGWGGLMRHAARHYGAKCTGLTNSRQQAEWAEAHIGDTGAHIMLGDWRCLESEVATRFDRIASVGMFEHVGHANYRRFFETARAMLERGGLFLLHTIGKNHRGRAVDPWLEKYIFPNGELPALGEIADACEGLFVMEDAHNFGADYDRTLMAWHRRFEEAWPGPGFEARYGERFRRMWRYYLLSCAGSFRARHNQLWQVVLSPEGVPGGYRRPA
jgi:cyclopropane-fatty-acyl-phospholipid synthase